MAFGSTLKVPKTLMRVETTEAGENLDEVGANAVGLNCGGLVMEEVSLVLKEMAAVTGKPPIAKPNAGVPHLRKGKTIHPVSVKIWPVCLGPQAFIDRIKELYSSGEIDREIPSSRELLTDRKRIIDVVCRSYGVKYSEILKTCRGKRNAARNAAIYLTRKLRLDTYKEIGDQYGIDNDRTVRSVFVHMNKTARKMEKLRDVIIKSQK